MALAPAVHGGATDPDVLDFSTGVSPLPPPSELLAAIRGADLSRYPHPTALPVREALAAAHHGTADGVVAGAGSVELIWALARAFAGPGRRGLVVRPAFGEYQQALAASGAGVVTVDMVGPDFDVPFATMETALALAPVALAFICRPSNPCLTSAPADALVGLARRWPGTLFVVDEAYLPMFQHVEGLAPAANVAVLRSLTKIFALPGLRLGYLLAAPPVAAAVQASLPPWNVSGPAQAAGAVAATSLPDQAEAIRSRLAVLRASLAARLQPLAGPPERAGGPFLLYRLPSAPGLVAALRARGILVRHCASFGLPQHVRIGVRDESEQETLARLWPRP